MSINDEFIYVEKYLELHDDKTKSYFTVDQSLKGIFEPESVEWKVQYYRNTIHYDFLINFLKHYNLIDEAIVLKGVALLDMEIYENLGQRLTGDIDLLVESFSKIEFALLSEEFKLIETKTWKGNDFKKVYQKNISGMDVAVELHTRLFYHVDFNDYSFCHSSNGFKILSREWMLLHLVGHLAFQHTFIKIHWLLEVKLYIAKYKNEIDWIKFNLLLKKFQFLNSWILTKHFIDLVFNNKRSKNLFLNYLCNLDFILFPEKHKVRYYLIKYLTKDSSKTFIGYAWHWLIASGWKK